MSDFVVNFYNNKIEYRSLSNFWECDVVITVGDTVKLYETGEHCFHGEKYRRTGENTRDENRRKVLLSYAETFLKPSKYTTAALAKKNGGKKGLLLSQDELKVWDSINFDLQTAICKWKLENYKAVRDDLIKSETKILIHPALRCSLDKLEKSRVWEGRARIKDGEIVILGKNQLGNIWMNLRKFI